MSDMMRDWKDLGRLMAGRAPQGEDEAPEGSPALAQMMAEVTALPAAVFHACAFASEPLAGRISAEQRREWARGAAACGAALADEVAEQHPGLGPAALAGALGIPVERSGKPTDTLLPVFAQYHACGKITLYDAHARAAQRLADEMGLAVDVEAVLLAHELFHHFEEQREDTTFTRGRHLRLGRGPFARSARVACLSEIGAAAFAGRLLGLPFPAGALDVLLLYTVSPSEARSLYRCLARPGAAESEKESAPCC